MTVYDLFLAWNWTHDADFVRLLESACQVRGLSVLQITPDNLDQIWACVRDGEIASRAFFDRASDTDDRFMIFDQWSFAHAIYRINPFRQARRAWDKPTMYEKFTAAGLKSPEVIVLPPYEQCSDPPEADLHKLGDRFAIKPAHGGGGIGVTTGATSWEQVCVARKEYPADQYLLQAQVVPARLEADEAWFRILYCAGDIYPCWWNTLTHVYRPLEAAEVKCYNLQSLWDVPVTIAQISNLELFSTEVALTAEGQFMVVDYVNDPIDLRLQSCHVDGIPDHIVKGIAERLSDLVLDCVLLEN
jgi:hypothetical protein